MLFSIFTYAETLAELKMRIDGDVHVDTENNVVLYLTDGQEPSELFRIYVYSSDRITLKRTVSGFPLSTFVEFRRELDNSPDYVRIENNRYYDTKNDIIFTLNLTDDTLLLIIEVL